MEKTLSELLCKNPNVGFVVNHHQYNIKNDNRYLVPFMVYEHNEIRFGFVDKNENIVIPAIYDKVYDDFDSENDLVRVGKRFCVNYGTEKDPRIYYYFTCGLIDSKGYELIACGKYERLHFVSQNLLVAHGNRLVERGCALLDKNGNAIVEYGVYDEIYNFAHGFARMRDCRGWGVIDEEGDCIISSGIFNEIWNMDARYNRIVVKRDGVRYDVSIEVLQKMQEELKTKGQIVTSIDDYLNYEEYLQNDFTDGWKKIQIDTNNL